MSKNKDPDSLLNIQHNYLHARIKGLQQPKEIYNLVIDKNVESILYKTFTKDQLLRIVASVELIDSERRKNTYMTAMYLCEKTIYNLKCIMADVQTKRYKNGIALFAYQDQQINPQASEFYQEKFLKNPSVIRFFNDGANFNEMTFAYNAVETRVFLTDDKTPNSMPIYYNKNAQQFVIPQVKKVAQSLLNLVVSMEEYPFIRFYSPLQGEYEAKTLPELIADEFQQQMDDYCRINDNYPTPEVSAKTRSILLITDRTIDLYAPILHEFTYQAMAMDIVESLEKRNVFEYQSENERGEFIDAVVKLDNENDEDWVNLRHSHIIESSELIVNKITELIKNNPLMIDRSKASTSSDLMYIVAHLKGFDEERKQLTLHKTLIDKCLDINASRKLAEFAADFEQTCCAEGISFEGERNKHLHDDLIILLARDDLHINDKLRLILIYAFYRGGLIRSDFEKMIKFVGVEDKHIPGLCERCFNNVDKLGFEIFKKDLKAKPYMKQMFHTINNEGTYNTSRFTPGIKTIMQNVARYSLDRDWFPYFRDKPLDDELGTSISTGKKTSSSSSLTGANASGTVTRDSLSSSGTLRNPRIKANWANSSTSIAQSRRYGAGGGSTFPSQHKQRIYCFVAGGITYSEIRSIYELSNSLNKEFYIGSESILKPRDFLIGLQNLGDNKTLEHLDLAIVKESQQSDEIPMYLYNDGGIPKPITRPFPSQEQQINYNSSSTMTTTTTAEPRFGETSSFQQQVEQQQEMYKSAHGNVAAPSTTHLHYQKRGTKITSDGGGNGETEKALKNGSKRSKLKKLFK
ncbi:sec1 [Candida oxycetoniae]|uniref:Sec1 n=1 Tax=Candida oxycetoniae TaxID=497107 RepID=A0AAI9T1C1_9ASCO|nr:sec1 [Candida oxycetoniae]KAI3406539.2 sec1 [Candida oxycetoniae]